MTSIDKIAHMTEVTVRGLCHHLSPFCIGCPCAKSYVSTDKNPMRDETKVKIIVRCDKMGMLGPACPDGGTPGGTYLKDLGVTRKLGEQSLAKTFGISREMTKGLDHYASGSVFKAPEFSESISIYFKAEEDSVARLLHEMTETIRYVTEGEDVSEPIVWIGEKKFETLNQAQDSYIKDHVIHIREALMPGSPYCAPTPYMKDHFPKEYVRNFGILTDPYEHAAPKRSKGASFEDVRFFGDDIPAPPKAYVPPSPDQDELYEDWGSFA